MNRIAAFVTEHAKLAWCLALTVILGLSILVGAAVRLALAEARLSALTTEARRQSVEIISQTLNGDVMGAMDLLGLIEPAIKYDAQGFMPPNGVQITKMLETIGQSYNADGVFIVGGQGILTSSWNKGSKPSTGLDVSFRPYFRIAMQGRNSVYAAVSMARNDRSLYFSVPVHQDSSRDSPAVGAVVARTNLGRIEGLLKDRADIMLLLSPQGVVFAGNHPDWVGALAGRPTPERLTAIRALKQFGAMFENRDPPVLPFEPINGLQSIDGVTMAMAVSPVQWNDSAGDWTLLLAEDLSRTVPARLWLLSAGGVAGLLLLLSILALGVLRSHHARLISARVIEDYAHQQEAAAQRKSELVLASRQLQRAKSRQELAATFLRECHRLLGALHGLVYDSDGQGWLTMLGSFADDGAAAQKLKYGEGLLGQCAADRQFRQLNIREEDALTILSGLGNSRPAAVLIMPLLLDEMVLGVVEIALLTTPAPHDQDMLHELASSLALNLEILRRHAKDGDATTVPPC